MKIRWYISVAIFVVALIVSILPNSFAYTSAEFPEPVPDQYNRYIVLNDFLIHFSYEIDYVCTVLNPTNSEWYRQTLTAYESSSGEINGSYGVPVYDTQGHLSENNGIYNFVNVSTYPSNNDYAFESVLLDQVVDGTVTYQDAELALTKVGQTEFSNLYDIKLSILDDHQIQIQIRKNPQMSESFAVSFRSYIGIFDISSGHMLNSFHRQFDNQVIQNQNYSINIRNISGAGVRETIDYLQVYGMLLINDNDIQYDIPQIIYNTSASWDTYFLNIMLYVEEIWRNMVDVTDAPDPETTVPWGEDLSNSVPKDEYTILPQQQKQEYTNVFQGVKLYSEESQQLENWVTMFSNGKLIACCVFALASGSVILVLGKKKSE